MKRDAQDELQRLSDALREEECVPAEVPEEDQWEAVLDDGITIGDVTEYKNHANHYGQIYNSDKTNVDPEELSDALLTAQEEAGSGKLLLTAIALILGIVAVAVYWVVRHG